MSYDFSFQKGQMWLLGGLATLMSVLLLAAGFLIGRLTLQPDATAASLPAIPTAPVLKAPAATRAASAAPAIASPAAGLPTGAEQDVPQLTPTAEAATVDIAAPATATPDVYQLTASGYTLQYGAFRDAANANELLKQLKDGKVTASVVTLQNAYGETFSVVRSGAYATVSDARAAAGEQANRLDMPIVVRPAGKL